MDSVSFRSNINREFAAELDSTANPILCENVFSNQNPNLKCSMLEYVITCRLKHLERERVTFLERGHGFRFLPGAI